MPLERLRAKIKGFVPIAWYFAKNDMRNRVAGSLMGAAWLVIQPLALMLLFMFLFSFVLKLKLRGGFYGTRSFSLFLVAGMIPWMAFQEGIMRAAVAVVENREVVKKIYIPLGALPTGYCLSVHFFYGVVLLLFDVFCFFKLWSAGKVGVMWLPVSAILLLLVYFLQFVCALGIGLFLSSIAVFIRDIIQALPLIMQVWFYLSPIVYPEYMVPKKARFLLSINPYNPFLKSYKLILLKGELPHLGYWFLGLLFSSCFFVFGYIIFRKLKGHFADVL